MPLVKLKQPITWYGGKVVMRKHLLEQIPEHHLYCEAFAGAGTLFWGKKPALVEVLNDTNFELINFYQVVKYRFNELDAMVKATLHSRKQHERAKMIYESPEFFNPVERAWALFVLANQSYCSSLGNGWGYERKTEKTTKKVINKGKNFAVELSKRLENVQLEDTHAIKCIQSRDCEGAFFYLDPPYPHTKQGHYKGYTMSDFLELLDCISNLKGKFLLSSYDYPELTEWVEKHGFHQKKFVKNLSASSLRGKKKVEVLTANYPLV